MKTKINFVILYQNHIWVHFKIFYVGNLIFQSNIENKVRIGVHASANIDFATISCIKD